MYRIFPHEYDTGNILEMYRICLRVSILIPLGCHSRGAFQGEKGGTGSRYCYPCSPTKLAESQGKNLSQGSCSAIGDNVLRNVPSRGVPEPEVSVPSLLLRKHQQLLLFLWHSDFWLSVFGCPALMNETDELIGTSTDSTFLTEPLPSLMI